MKQYPKTYKDLSRQPGDKRLSCIGSSLGSVDNLALSFRNFYKEAHLIIFDLNVKEVWLEQHFLYDGVRRANRSRNGYNLDWTFSYFMKSIVGISQKPLTCGFFFATTATYFIDFFPNFLDHNPFEEPEYFKYPYKHVTLDFLAFVYQCHNRLKMLQEAEDKKMNIQDFMNWAANYELSYSSSLDKELYCIVRHNFIPYLKKIK